jgi:sugar O-acyltransferase (sialic acid O-acetyltransferase NeuD family)
MAEKIAIWGSGGHARVVSNIARLCGGFEIVGFLDDLHPQRRGEAFCGATILGGAEQVEELARNGVRTFVLAFGNSSARLQKAQTIEGNGLCLATLVHPAAVIAPDVNLGAGTTVNAGAIVDPGATIGRCVIIGAGVTIGHDCTLGDGVRVSGGSCIGGGAFLERCALVGTGGRVCRGIRVGAGSLVGVGAVLIKDLPAGLVAVGNPARVIRSAREDDV